MPSKKPCYPPLDCAGAQTPSNASHASHYSSGPPHPLMRTSPMAQRDGAWAAAACMNAYGGPGGCAAGGSFSDPHLPSHFDLRAALAARAASAGHLGASPNGAHPFGVKRVMSLPAHHQHAQFPLSREFSGSCPHPDEPPAKRSASGHFGPGAFDGAAASAAAQLFGQWGGGAGPAGDGGFGAVPVGGRHGLALRGANALVDAHLAAVAAAGRLPAGAGGHEYGDLELAGMQPPCQQTPRHYAPPPSAHGAAAARLGPSGDALGSPAAAATGGLAWPGDEFFLDQAPEDDDAQPLLANIGSAELAAAADRAAAGPASAGAAGGGDSSGNDNDDCADDILAAANLDDFDEMFIF
jgi:hypothetical protein